MFLGPILAPTCYMLQTTHVHLEVKCTLLIALQLILVNLAIAVYTRLTYKIMNTFCIIIVLGFTQTNLSHGQKIHLV